MCMRLPPFRFYLQDRKNLPENPAGYTLLYMVLSDSAQLAHFWQGVRPRDMALDSVVGVAFLPAQLAL